MKEQGTRIWLGVEVAPAHRLASKPPPHHDLPSESGDGKGNERMMSLVRSCDLPRIHALSLVGYGGRAV
jgi:hypothetical protein